MLDDCSRVEGRTQLPKRFFSMCRLTRPAGGSHLPSRFPSLLSHLAPHSLQYASEESKMCPLSLSEGTHRDVLLVTKLP